ncbi:hypothetical protein ACQP3F_32880, partial [Escherichia coli]
LVIPDQSKTFIMNGSWILLKAFAVYNEMILWFFFFQIVYVVDTLTNFPMFIQSCISWKNPLGHIGFFLCVSGFCLAAFY